MIDLKKGFQYGLAIGVGTWLIAWLLSLAKIGTIGITLAAIDINVRQQIIAGLDTTFVGKLIGSLTGALPFTITSILLAILTGILISVVGLFIVDLSKQWYSPKTQLGKLAYMLTLGTLAVGLVAGTVLPKADLSTIGVVLTLFIYYLGVGVVVMWIGNAFPKLRFLKIPSM